MLLSPSFSRFIVVSAVVVAVVVMFAAAAETSAGSGGGTGGNHSHAHDDGTRTHAPAHHTSHPPHSPRHKASMSSDSALNVDAADWWWIAPVLATVFLLFLLSTVKLKSLGGKSMRAHLMRFFSCEALYETLGGAPLHHFREQRDIELGHQFLTFVACGALIADWRSNSNRDGRLAVVVLTTAQMFLLFACALLDCFLLRRGFVRPVRSANTKLRWAQCTYQTLLFCTEAIGSGFELSLPVDCFVVAVAHYIYEAVALALEGLNIIGMSEFTIVILVVTKLLSSPLAAEGWRLGFGLTSLALSSMSLLVAAIWKLRNLTPAQHESSAVDYLHDPLSANLVENSFTTSNNTAAREGGCTGEQLRRRAIHEHLGIGGGHSISSSSTMSSGGSSGVCGELKLAVRRSAAASLAGQSMDTIASGGASDAAISTSTYSTSP